MQAHKSRAPEKIRIHVYKSKAFVLKHWHQYEQFLDEMCLYGVELYLISLERFNQLGNMPLNGGGIVFDDTCLVLLHNQLDDLPGKDVGTFVFVTEQVIKYKEQLWELKSHAMSPDQFRAIILSSDNRKRSKMLVSEETQ